MGGEHEDNCRNAGYVWSGVHKFFQINNVGAS